MLQEFQWTGCCVIMMSLPLTSFLFTTSRNRFTICRFYSLFTAWIFSNNSYWTRVASIKNNGEFLFIMILSAISCGFLVQAKIELFTQWLIAGNDVFFYFKVVFIAAAVLGYIGMSSENRSNVSETGVQFLLLLNVMPTNIWFS